MKKLSKAFVSVFLICICFVACSSVPKEDYYGQWEAVAVQKQADENGIEMSIDINILLDIAQDGTFTLTTTGILSEAECIKYADTFYDLVCKQTAKQNSVTVEEVVEQLETELKMTYDEMKQVLVDELKASASSTDVRTGDYKITGNKITITTQEEETTILELADNTLTTLNEEDKYVFTKK